MAVRVSQVRTTSAGRQFDKLDKPAQQRLADLIRRIESLADPRVIGAALHGPLKEFWKFRAGDWCRNAAG